MLCLFCWCTSVGDIVIHFLTVFHSEEGCLWSDSTGLFWELHFHRSPYRRWFAVHGSGRIKRENFCNFYKMWEFWLLGLDWCLFVVFVITAYRKLGKLRWTQWFGGAFLQRKDTACSDSLVSCVQLVTSSSGSFSSSVQQLWHCQLVGFSHEFNFDVGSRTSFKPRWKVYDATKRHTLMVDQLLWRQIRG